MRSKHLPIAFIFGMAAASLCGSTIRVAVKRGQTTIDPKVLPLACVTVTTINAALPLDVMYLEETTTHTEYKVRLLKSFGSNAEALTAVAGGNRSLTLAILHLPAGRYRLNSLELLGPSDSESSSSYTIDLKQGVRYEFTVTPGYANFVGGLTVSGPWGTRSRVVGGYDQIASSATFDIGLSVENSVQRDMNWAADVIPGMRTLPWRSSLMEESPEAVSTDTDDKPKSPRTRR